MKYRINNWDELRDALQREDYVVMLDAGPVGGEEAEVIDYTVGPEAYPDQEWLDEEGFADEEEWYQAYRGTPAIVIDRPMGQGGTNTRILDTIEVSDFEIYGVRAGKYDDEMFENRRLRGSSRRLREHGGPVFKPTRLEDFIAEVESYGYEVSDTESKKVFRVVDTNDRNVEFYIGLCYKQDLVSSYKLYLEEYCETELAEPYTKNGRLKNALKAASKIVIGYDEDTASVIEKNRQRKILRARGMTEYGVSHADEIYQDNYERELAKSGDKYIVFPRTQATNRYLTGEFGIHDSYELSFDTLRDLVNTCVKSNDDIKVYEAGSDYYFKDDGRVWDVLGFVLDEPLKESRKRARIAQNKRSRY